MPISPRIRPGFSYDEAILMCNFCKRSYDLFRYIDEGQEESDIKSLYNSIYREWKLVHEFNNPTTSIRGFILRRAAHPQQYAVVFRGSILTSQGTVDLTNASADVDWSFINYGSMINQGIKVCRGFFLAFESVSAEIKIFFKTLTGTLKPIDFQNLSQLTPLKQFACAVAIADAGAIVMGGDFEQKIKELIASAVEDGEIGNNDDVKNILDYEQEVILGAEKRSFTPVELYVVGHSLGGALANLCALALRQEFDSQKDSTHTVIKVYTFGGAKVGNKDFAEYYNKRIGLDMSYRVENFLDTAPQIPMPPPFPLNVLFPGGLRIGNYFLGNYASLGDVQTVVGLGAQRVSLSFGGALEFLGGIPFPHSYDTYISLLKEQQEFWRVILQPIKSLLEPTFRDLFKEEEELQQDRVILILQNLFQKYDLLQQENDNLQLGTATPNPPLTPPESK